MKTYQNILNTFGSQYIRKTKKIEGAIDNAKRMYFIELYAWTCFVCVVSTM